MNLFRDITNLHEYIELLRTNKVNNVNKHYKKIAKKVFNNYIKPGTLRKMKLHDTLERVKYNNGTWTIEIDYTTLVNEIQEQASIV